LTPYYEDSAVTIYHGNCLDVLPQLGQVDHVITDPPYARDVYLRARTGNEGPGSRYRPNYRNAASSLVKMAAGDIGSIDEAMVPVAAEMGRLARRWVVVFSDAETTHRWKAELETSGLRYVRTGAWVKPDAMPQMGGDRPSVGFEPCTIAHAQGRMRWNGGGRQALWTYGTARVNRPDHPCPKPEPLMSHLVRDFTDAGETILDPFMGSGTTLVAAKRLGRKAIGIELNEKYCEIAAKRCAQGSLFAPGETSEPTQPNVWGE
jgi:DNA modification methylase